MDEDEYAEFINGGFTIRRTDKFWSGIWSDMTIEQALMRTMKDIGGPTRGRGMSESVLTKWVLTTPALVELTDSLTDFCSVYLATTEQHVYSRATRIARDLADMEKLKSWFKDHNPFPDTDDIISLSSGLKGAKNDNINCHEALEIGLRCLTEMSKENENGTPKTFNDVKYKRKKKITSLKALTSTIKFSDRNVTIDPSLLFQRICVLKKSDEELKAYLNYELAPYPLSLFDDKGMRKTPKAKLFDFFTPVQRPVKGSDIYVIDSGFFLHKVVWRQNDKFDGILTNYVNYLKNHYLNNCIVVFDGYPDKGEEKHTKSAERHRRGRFNCLPEVVCDINILSKSPQDKFLSNEKNKRNFINILSPKLRDEGFIVKQAVEDADSLIINTAISVSDSYESVYVIGEDVDSLVILSQIAQAKNNIYLLKPGRQSAEEKLYSSSSFQYPEIQHFICFIHAFTCCDTTSSLYNTLQTGKSQINKTFEE
ncbi:hypothetical protein KPH14_007626 [Odynerus spinipes]|uniref:Uncharacterized protein n=1 Tax=Odynerus spinipes TaxID=1348599 RepID=A0AAD9VM79_9HYME|nr:hypothetical protein KPH14_007626 [Odynerus spinipes]